jgi:serine/threonine protein kinase
MSSSDKLSRGTILGRYELLLPIAQGGMATVWAARQKGSRGFQKTVAVKTMLPTLSDDPQFEQMFLDEAALAARIHHPNVAEILDLGEQDDVLYIVMEWVDGEALSVVTKTAKRNKTQYPMRIALRMLTQACAGLHAAHELRDDNEQPLELVHRDVSPQNILVTYDGVVKLVDFGVAKAIGQRMSARDHGGPAQGQSPVHVAGAGARRARSIGAPTSSRWASCSTS